MRFKPWPPKTAVMAVCAFSDPTRSTLKATESANATNTANLPPFAWTYVPDANGAAGGYYIDGNVTPYSPSEIYGAKQPAS